MKGYLVIPVTIIICISIMVANGELFEIVETRIVSTRIIDTINDVTVTSCIIQCQGYKDCVTIGFRKQPNVVMLLSSCYFLKEEQAIKKDTAGEPFVNVFVLKKIGTETLAVLSNLKSTSEPSTTATSPTTTKSSGETPTVACDMANDIGIDIEKAIRKTSTWKLCAIKCTQFNYCKFFTWHPNNDCFLQSYKDKRVDKPGAISGSRGCGY